MSLDVYIMHRSSIELQNLIEPHNPSFCQTLVTGSTGLNVLSLFDGMNPAFRLVFVVDFRIFALWKNN